jgi:hypothetical protein
MLRIARSAPSLIGRGYSSSKLLLLQKKKPLCISNARCLSSTSGTWNWNNFGASKNDESKSEDHQSQESLVLKKCAELYLSLMPLNDKVRPIRAENIV